MTIKKTTRYFFFIALLILSAALIWRVKGNAVNAQDTLALEDIPMNTPEASSTPTSTATPTTTNTPDPQSSQTPAADATETATPTSTATVVAPQDEHFSYLPVLADIPPPAPLGCIPLPHIPAYSISTEQHLATLLNTYRSSKGKSALNLMPHLSLAARRHALDMAENNHQDHTGSDGSSIGSRTSDACYEWVYIGEILGSNETVQSMVNSWTNTADNRDLILSAEYIDFGTAYFYDPDSLYHHHWVVVFARPRTASQFIE